MGSVSMQSQGSSRGEHLSAVVDGEGLDSSESFDNMLAEFDHVDRTTWSAYHLIGDALRSDDLAVHPATSSAFLAGFAARLEAEPHIVAPASRSARRGVSRLRRRIAPALAVAAAAATLSWIVLPQLQHGALQGAVQTATNGHADGVQTVAMVNGVGAPQAPMAQADMAQPNIIRDANLDQYLEAHQQFAQQPMMPGSMPLIRAAVQTSQGQ